MRIATGMAPVRKVLSVFTKLIAGAIVSSACLTAVAQTWVTGDVFAGVGNGQYNVYTNTGTFKQTITDSFNNGYTTGCSFTNDLSKLYTTNFSNDTVFVFDGTGATHSILKQIDTSSAGASNESLVFDKSGNWYVGHADGARGIIKFSASDVSQATYFPETEDRGTDWLDLAADQKTVFYTSEGPHVKRFNVSTDTQLADFSSALPQSAYAHRLLPPYDGSGGLLVADTSAILRLDRTGKVIQTYTVAGAQAWFSLNLDPNGTSFWAGDLGTNYLYRFNIASGSVEVGPINTTSKNGLSLGGVCVRGELTSSGGGADKTPPVVTLQSVISGPPKQVLLATHDTQSGLKSITVLDCTNCTASTANFTVGTNSNVITTSTKTNQSESSTIKLRAVDVAGNVTVFDPVDFEIQDGGRQRSHTVSISPAEHTIKIANGTPGARWMEIEVNEQVLPPVSLRDGQEKSIDIQRYLSPSARNEVTVTAFGPRGGTSWIVITQ